MKRCKGCGLEVHESETICDYQCEELFNLMEEK